ncbi:MAG TPA: zinc ribbon domain-containing protein [Ktedonobacteraceae bacterium]|nr:zinc ribbon domain-containing protein [Ktedonobacteraceae bacterium]
MTICERCGNEIPEHITICPSCGTPLSEAQTGVKPANANGTSAYAQPKTKVLPFDSLYADYIPQPEPIYERNYAAHPANPDRSVSKEPSSTGTDPEIASTTTRPHSSRAKTGFRSRFLNGNTNIPLLIEVLLSFPFGIFGVGWLLIGENLIGMLLLAGSVFFYMPLLIFSYVLAYFSYGLSFSFTGPFALGVVFLNAYMLNKTLKRKRVADHASLMNVDNRMREC